MNLTEIYQATPVEIVRDTIFESLGGLNHKTPKMLVFLESEKFLPALLENPSVTCVITNQDISKNIPENYGLAVSENPRKAFYLFHNYLANNTDFYWKDFPTEISPEAQVHPKAFVAEKNVRIGAGTIIEPNATVLEKTIIRENVILRPNCTIGCQGFEFKRIDGKILGVAHAGGVKLENGVEIQSSTVIDKAIFGGFTEIGEDSKIDNLIHIAHNVKIGKRCLVAAGAMIAGSVVMGDDVWVGPSASISSGIIIGDKASITIGSVVTRNLEAGQQVSGNFAVDHQKFIKFIKTIR